MILENVKLRSKLKYVSLVAILLTGCVGNPVSDLSIPCPPWPIAGTDVADELERIPFRGYSDLAALVQVAKNISPHNDQEVNEFMTFFLMTTEKMKPEEGFEHLWTWINDLHDLKEQLDECNK